MSYQYREAEPENKDKVHPIWRGIGCLLLVIIPVISFAASVLLVEEGLPQQYIRMTSDLAKRVDVPGFGPIPFLYILIITAVISVLGFVFMTVAYSIVYMFTGRSKYGPLDSPPIKRKVKKSR
ncbi:MAG: hypothetical protein HC806_02565 [Anaerolineae bacterium]|nr:hypothetical protein [Anaerolineae bacterium]